MTRQPARTTDLWMGEKRKKEKRKKKRKEEKKKKEKKKRKKGKKEKGEITINNQVLTKS